MWPLLSNYQGEFPLYRSFNYACNNQDLVLILIRGSTDASQKEMLLCIDHVRPSTIEYRSFFNQTFK